MKFCRTLDRNLSSVFKQITYGRQLTPKHGSWLNLIECAFSKMARAFLRHIRVNSIDELKTRILQGIEELNASPVVFRWKKFDLGVA